MANRLPQPPGTIGPSRLGSRPVGDQGTNAIAALVLGSVVAVLLFIPVAAVQYRRDGRLGAGDLMVLVGAAVYGVSLWTYTLLPLPDVGDYACQHAQTQVMAFADDIRRAAERGGYAGLGTPSELLRNQAFLQVVLNVVLFLPVRRVRPADHPPRGGGRDGARLRGVPAHRGHPAHRRVGRLPLRLPAVRRRRPADQHAGRVPRRPALHPVRRPATSPARHGPSGAADHGVGGAPARRDGERRALRGAGRHGRGGAAARLPGLRPGRAPGHGLAGHDRAAGRRTAAGEAAMVLLAGKTIGELVVDLRTIPASVAAPAGQARRRRRAARAARRRRRPGSAGRPAGRSRWSASRRVPDPRPPRHRATPSPGSSWRSTTPEAGSRRPRRDCSWHADPRRPRPRPGGRRRSRRDDHPRLGVLRTPTRHPSARPTRRLSTPRRGSCSSRTPAHARRWRWSGPTAPTGPRRSTTSASGHQSNPDWSPDGEQFVFAMSDGERDDLWVADADGGHARLLLDCAACAAGSTTPTGRPTAGASSTARPSCARAAGGSARWRPSTSSPAGSASCSARGSRDFTAGRAVLARRPPGRLREGAQDRRGPDADIDGVTLSVVRLDKPSHPVRALTDPQLYAATADWSPDGERIAYSALAERRRRGTGPLLDRAWRRRADAGSRRWPTRAASPPEPGWLADGSGRAVQRPSRCRVRKSRAADRAPRRQRCRLGVR